jgi:hypothetical protein
MNWVTINPFSEAEFSTPRPYIAHLPSETPSDSGGTIDWTQIQYIGCAVPVSGISGGTFGRDVRFWFMLRLPIIGAPVVPLSICGGSPNYPFDARDVAKILKVSANNSLTYLQGAKQNSFALSVQIGDGGLHPTYFNGSAGSTEFTDPAVAGIEILEGALQYRIKAGDADEIRFGAQAVGSTVPQVFAVDADSSLLATVRLRGTLFNMRPSFQDGSTVSDLTLEGCTKALGSSSNFNQCSFTNCRSTDAALQLIDGGGCNGSAFEQGAETYAVEVVGNGPATINFAGVEYDHATPINILGTTGTITIVLALGDAEPAYDTAGALVEFDQPVFDTTWINEDLADGTTILSRNATTSTTISYIASLATGTGYAETFTPGVDYTPGDVLEIWQSRKNGTTYYVERTSRIITSAAGGTITEADELAVCPICTAFGLDGAVPPISTKFDADLIDDEIDIDVGGPWQMAEAMVWWKTQMTIQASMEDLWGTLDVQSDGSFYNASAGSKVVKFDTTSATDAIESTGRRFHNDLGTRPIKSPTTGIGALDLSWRDPVTVVSVGSGVLPSDVTDIAVATRAELAVEMARLDVAVSTRLADDVSAIADATRAEIDADSTQLAAIRNLVEADEYHTTTTVEKRLRGTSTVLLTKNHTGTPLVDLSVAE